MKLMGMFDTFIDLERGRESQSKAFSETLSIYYHDVDSSDMVERGGSSYRTYYVFTYQPCFLIRIEGNLFTGIVSVLEDKNFAVYPVLDYIGGNVDMTDTLIDNLKTMTELYDIIEKNAGHLPMRKLREDYNAVSYCPVNKISGQKSHYYD